MVSRDAEAAHCLSYNQHCAWWAANIALESMGDAVSSPQAGSDGLELFSFAFASA